MKHVSSLLFLYLVLFVSSSWAQTPSSAKDFASSCTSRFKQQDWDGAMADCNKAIELNPHAADGYIVRSLILGNIKGNLDGAIADLDKAVEIDPNNSLLYKLRGLFKSTKKDFEGAIEDFNKLLEKDTSAESYDLRGATHFYKGEIDKAIDDFNLAVDKSPGSVRSYTLRARAKFAKKDWGGAIADYNIAVKLDPKPPDAYFYRGLALLSDGKDSQAQKDFDKFLELAPGKKAFLEKWIEKTKQERETKK